MYIKKEYDFSDLIDACWCGALDTLKTIEKFDKEDELMEHLKEVFETNFDKVPTMTEINDYLWFGWENIFECLGIFEEDEEQEEDEENDCKNQSCVD